MTGGTIIKGISHFRRVLSEDPNHADALAWLANFYAFLGVRIETEQLLARLSRIDPFHFLRNKVPVMLDILTGEFESAAKQARELVKSSTEDLTTAPIALTLMYNGQFEEAFTILDRISDSLRGNFMYRIVLLYKYAYQNKQTEFEHLIVDEFKLWAIKDCNYSFWLAEAYTRILC